MVTHPRGRGDSIFGLRGECRSAHAVEQARGAGPESLALHGWRFWLGGWFRSRRGGRIPSMTKRKLPGSHRSAVLWLACGALGIVYGDIGTSPLYALRECFYGQHGIDPTAANVLGVLSLIAWSLIVVISIKYLMLIMRADNDGEGGILALMSLAVGPDAKGRLTRRGVLVLMGLFGAALLYGDGMITPAISVLSAVEGLEVATSVFKPYIVPITIAILLGLFAFQNRGTERIGVVFGPLMLLWFLVLAVTGFCQIASNTEVLFAFHPVYAVRFFVDNRLHGFWVLGVVFLVVTGGEALYADMGHFGKRPIRLAWFVIVMPALLLNYFGQGALLLADPREATNPFYHLAPSWALYPMVILATAATVVASQAVISGAFSLTMQAVQLGYLPRMEIRHTSEREYGQIYVPAVNVLLLLCTVGLVLGFGTSSRLAAAYGVAVTTTMVITTVLAYFVIRHQWNWPWPAAALVIGTLLVVDFSFFAGNMVKIPTGGWFPLLVGLMIVTVMTTWSRGRQLFSRRLETIATTYEDFFVQIDADPPLRVPGTAIHLCRDPTKVPRTMLENLQYNHVLHQRVAIVSVVFDRVPFVRSEKRIECDVLREDVFRITIHYGFKQAPHVPRALTQQELEHLQLELETAVYILGRETLLARRKPGMAIWRERLFAFLARNALEATAFFHIPPRQVLEIGTRVEL